MAVLDTWTRQHIPNTTEDHTNNATQLMPWYEVISTHGRHVWTTLDFASPPGPSDSLPSACRWASSRPRASYSPSIELDELADVVPVLGLRINWGQHTPFWPVNMRQYVCRIHSALLCNPIFTPFIVQHKTIIFFNTVQAVVSPGNEVYLQTTQHFSSFLNRLF
jgi:hypothetical protein